jgi:hypothetical protein
MTADPTATDDSQPSVTLYGAKTGNCLRVSIALEEAFVPYHVAHIDLSAGGQPPGRVCQAEPARKGPDVGGCLRSEWPPCHISVQCDPALHIREGAGTTCSV